MPGRPDEDLPGQRFAPVPADRFGAVLRSLRQTAGVTQRELADLAGLSAGAIRDLEQGRSKSPKQDSIEAIAAALALSGHDAGILQAAAGSRRSVMGANPGVAGALRIGVLGPVEVWHGPVLVPINSGPQRTLLARLALAAGTTVSQDELVDLLWPRNVPSNAANLLHTRAARLRRVLAVGGPANRVVAGDTGYRLALSKDELDLLTFRDLLAEAERAAPAAALAKLAEAVALWRGDTDLEMLAADPLYLEVVNEYKAAVLAFATLSRQVGEPEQALKPLRDLATRHELDEPLHVELIQTLAAADRQVEALAAYDRIRSALAGQLGIDPGERLRAVHLEVLRRQHGPPVQRMVIQQAPSAPPDFIGRADELATICAALARPGALSSQVVLISGIAGVGKTALSLTAAHRLRAEYPDGQLYADLRGSDATTPAPIQVLGRFLRALGVPGRRIGTDETEAAALFRSELADRRMLVLLDNAQDATQVRPLLPGVGRSDVIVTSRRRLPDLAAAGVVNLKPLTQDDAIRLIASTARTHRLDADHDGVSALAEACARLPLALRIAGARLATRPEWTVTDLARRLDDGNRRLTELSLGESSVLNSFQLSYADLSIEAQRAFRLCSLHPGDDFSADSTGILLGLPTVEAERVLEDLLEANMLLQHTKNRYRFHDLLGLYSRRLVAEDSEADAARTRLYSWYVEAVTAAIDWAYPQLVRLSAHPEPATYFDSETGALGWLDDELRSLLAVVKETADSGEKSLSWRIADQLRGYFLIRRHADGRLPAAQASTAAALTAGDDRAQVAMLINRGQALDDAGQSEDALSDCLAGHSLAVAVGWTTAAAYLAHQIGWLQLERSTVGDADLWMRRALELTEDDPHGHVRAIALNGLGKTCVYRGELREAADLFGSALQINEIGRGTSALAIRGNLASALRQLGEVDRAAGMLADVLEAYQRRSHLRGELSTLDELARLYGQRGDAMAALEVALRAHELALVIRDRKAQAQTASTVAQAHLTFGDPAAAIKWSTDCLAIARNVYRYIEAEALFTLAAAQRRTGDSAAAADATEQATAIAVACGFRLLETWA